MSHLDARGTDPLPARPCPLCGEPDATGASPAASSDGGPRPVTCDRCGLVFIDPVPPEALERESYGEEYYAPWRGREEAARLSMWRRRLRAIARRAPTGTLLDIGCGDGLFLAVARDAGWRVEGIEFSPVGARLAAGRLGRPVAVGDLARTAHLQGPFDVVTLWHVLEHLPEPRPMLEAARRRLREGGLLIVAVPNLDNLPMRLAYRVARGRALPLYEAGAREPHLTHFSPVTLRAILEGAGFGAIEIEPDRCALSPAKRAIDAIAAATGRLRGRLLTDAIAGFSRRIR